VDLHVAEARFFCQQDEVVSMETRQPETTIDGFDPLGVDTSQAGPSMAQVFDEANKRVVHNILKCYTGYYDLFSEMFQNALDALQLRQRREGEAYQPRVWVLIDIPGGIVRVVDNGVGMSEHEFKYCLRPSVSFKKQADLRGYKGLAPHFSPTAFHFSNFRASSHPPLSRQFSDRAASGHRISVEQCRDRSSRA
jgi:hypothetical protein